MARLQLDTDTVCHEPPQAVARLDHDLAKLLKRLKDASDRTDNMLGQFNQLVFSTESLLRKYPLRTLSPGQLRLLRTRLDAPCQHHLARFLDTIMTMVSCGGPGRCHYRAFSHYAQVMHKVRTGTPPDSCDPLWTRLQRQCKTWLEAEIATLSLQAALVLPDRSHHVDTVAQLMSSMELVQLAPPLGSLRAQLRHPFHHDFRQQLAELTAAVPKNMRWALQTRNPHGVEKIIRTKQVLSPACLQSACLLLRHFMYTQLEGVSTDTPLSKLVDLVEKLTGLEREMAISASKLPALSQNIKSAAGKLGRLGLFALQLRAPGDSSVLLLRQRLCLYLGALQSKGWLDRACQQLLHECRIGLQHPPNLSDMALVQTLDTIDTLHGQDDVQGAARLTCWMLTARGYIADLATGEVLMRRLECKRSSLAYPTIGWLFDRFKHLKEQGYNDSNQILVQCMSRFKARCMENRECVTLLDSAKAEQNWRRIAGKAWIFSMQQVLQTAVLTGDMVTDLEELHKTTHGELLCEVTRAHFQCAIIHVLNIVEYRPATIAPLARRLDALTNWAGKLAERNINPRDTARNTVLKAKLANWRITRTTLMAPEPPAGERAAAPAAGPGPAFNASPVQPLRFTAEVPAAPLMLSCPSTLTLPFVPAWVQAAPAQHPLTVSPAGIFPTEAIPFAATQETIWTPLPWGSYPAAQAATFSFATGWGAPLTANPSSCCFPRISEALNGIENLRGTPLLPPDSMNRPGCARLPLQTYTQMLTEALLPLFEDAVMCTRWTEITASLWQPDNSRMHTEQKTKAIRALLEQLAGTQIRTQNVSAGQELLTACHRLCALRLQLGLTVQSSPVKPDSEASSEKPQQG
ncbi:MAG: hypothetical protein OXC07_01900 [Kistimonas sp.]|nr:hypothetical protein [Kistimonas sp.]